MESKSNQSSSDVLNLKQVHEQTLQAKKEKRKEYRREYQRQLRKTPAHQAKEKLRKSSPKYKEQRRKHNKIRRSDPNYREKQREYKKQLSQNPEHQAKEKLRKSQPKYKEQQRHYRKITKLVPERQLIRKKCDKRRRDNPAYREKLRAYQKELNQNPVHQAKEKLRKLQPEHKRKSTAYDQKRATDPVRRESQRQYQKQLRQTLEHQAKEKLRKSTPKYKAQQRKRKQEWRDRIKLLRQGGVIASQSGRIGIPENKLLEYLNLNQDLPFTKTGVNIQAHLQSLSLPNLIKSFPAIISDKFLKRKSYWIYVLVAVNWKETRNPKTMAEVDEIIRSEANNTKKTVYVYVGLNSCGKMANKYHARTSASTPNKFHKKGFRVFEAHFLNCNVGCVDLKKMSGNQLRAEILKQEIFMRHLEAFMIRYGDTRNGLRFSGMRQELMNKRMEPLSKTETQKADQLATTKVEMFNFDPKITKPQINPATVFAANLPFKLIKELKFVN